MSASAPAAGKSGDNIVTKAGSWIIVLAAILVIVTTFLGPHRSYVASENLADGLVAATDPNAKTNERACRQGACTRAPDGLPIVDASRQLEPFVIPPFSGTSFYVVGDDILISYGHCWVEVLPKAMRATGEDYLLGIGHIRPTTAQQMTKVTVISSDAPGCGT